jgi:elongation factor 1-alpha
MAEQKKENADGSAKTHVSIVICGHVDSGKSTTTGRLIFDLGGIPEREMQKLKDEAKTLGKDSFAFAFYMDKSKEERARGVTIACTTKEFFTQRYHYTVIDAPGHRDFIKNMISGASQADVALIMVPADGNFTTAIQRGNHKQGIVQGQTRQHARLINLLGVKQICVGINKMDTDVAGYKKERYDEIKAEMASTLMKVGWKKAMVQTSVPFLPISGWMGDNLLTKSDKMPWWAGQDIVKPLDGAKIKVVTLLDVLNNMVEPPTRDGAKPTRMPVSGVYKIKGVGDVITGRVEQGKVSPGDQTKFVPTDTPNLACQGKIFTVEMHHTTHAAAHAGDNVGLNVKGLAKENMPRVGDVMVQQKDDSLKQVASFMAQVQILDHPGELKPGYSPIAFIRTGRSAVKLSKIDWKIGKETGGQKAPDPAHLKANEMAQCHFEPQQPFTCEGFQACEGLGRVAILEGASVVMLGKIVKVVNGGVVKADKKK